uniref:uncharacterized protein LOC120346698 n=1 Tax=Styela clava TaxID=7725 RepID=UPI001939B20E|nr:uncharacterized protein LOC120346698 [Styela clava]
MGKENDTNINMAENVSSNTIPRVSQRKLQREHSKCSSKLRWNNVNTEVSRKSMMTPSLDIKDYDPSFALRKIAMLYEKDDKQEAINIISHLSIDTLLDIYKDFPLDIFMDSIPQSLGILDCILTRLFLHNAEKFPKSDFELDVLVMHIVKLYSRHQSADLPKLRNWESTQKYCSNILKIMGFVDGSSILKMLRHRRRCLHRAIESLGKHGLVEVEITPSSEEKIIKKLLSLPDALGVELERMIINSKTALHKLSLPIRGESDAQFSSRSSTIKSKSQLSSSTAPSQCNHQRMIGLTSTHIQERLYQNKMLLNVVEPVMQYAQLPWLLTLLQERIERDKDVLLTFSQLRKEITSVPADTKLSQILLQYSDAFTAVIDILKVYVEGDSDIPDVPDSSENGFKPYIYDGEYPKPASHISTGSPSAGNSTVGSIERSPRKTDTGKRPSKTSNKSTEQECERLQRELKRAQQAIDHLRKREKDLVRRLSQQAETFLSKSPNFETITAGVTRPAELIRRYRNLYSEGRVQAFDAIDEILRQDESDSSNARVNDVKSKLLFSVIVLSFRSVADTLDNIRMNMRQTLCMSNASKKSNITNETERMIFSYLKNTADTYDVSHNFKEVFNRVCDALYECPELRSSVGLQSYVSECVHLSWLLSVQTPPFTIEYDAAYFDDSRHERFHTSDNASNEITSFLWPSLLVKESGKCYSKGIVITGE